MSAPSPSDTLTELAGRYWRVFLDYHPSYASSLGHREYDHLLPDSSPKARAAHFAALKGLSDELKAIDGSALGGEDAITLESLGTTLRQDLAAEAHREDRWSINPLFGTHVWIAEMASRQPVGTDKELGALRSRFSQVPAYVAQELSNFQEGLDLGQVAFEAAVERTIGQIQRILNTPRSASPFLPPSLREGATPEGLSTEAIAAFNKTIDTDVIPALKRYQTFLESSYAPKARTSPGLNSIPGGEDYYRYSISYFTGRERDPQVVHQTGLDEISRLQEEMKIIAEEVTGSADLSKFQAHLRTRSDQTLPTKEGIVDFNQGLMDRAEAILPDYFNKLPSHSCQVRAIEAFREADSPAGYYDRAPGDGSRPAYYYVNTHNPSERPLYNMEALAFHEAVPGHHLQIALAQELSDLPAFRRNLGETAYIEGWALYTERLADEMGLYSSPLARFGMLNFQAWRAARLVVDTGLHAMNWSREQAINFLMDVTGFGHTDAAIEVDRYIVMPGQALAYMLGRMEIDAMRARAQERLGDQFDIKEFHGRVLHHGALPLASLNRLIDGWLDTKTQ